MQPPQKHSRINLADMKDQLSRKLGPERSKQYFDYLKRFLSLKLTKIEFDKLCLRTIGKDNISLHNQLLRSLLKNACTRKLPPPPPTIGSKKVHHENGSVTAPLGIPCGARKVSSLGSNRKCVSVFDTGGLMETFKLKERMDQITATQGLQGVSMECATVLNNGLDAYLKGLIRSFTHFRSVNGVRPGQHFQIQREPKRPISLLDFRVAMELNPQQLGEDWPLLLEKICTHAFEE